MKSKEICLLVAICYMLGLKRSNSVDDWLSHIGYARLFSYFKPFLIKESEKITEIFLPNVSFKNIVELYSFDRKLKILTLDAISKIETSIRANLAYIIGEDYRVVHDKKNAKKIFMKNFLKDKKGFKQWRNKIKASYKRSSRESPYRSYSFDSLPIWFLIEFWDFGSLSTCVYNLLPKYKYLLAKRYKLNSDNGDEFADWIKKINYLRNICSHHDILWNRKFNKLTSTNHNFLKHINDSNKLYGYLSVLCFLLVVIDKSSDWKNRLKKRIKSFPKSDLIKIKDMGFPDDWESNLIWQKNISLEN